MNIALPLLLLVLGSLSFWLLTESSLKWYIKTACISTFCIFTVIFWSSIHSFLGWPAKIDLEDDVPDVVKIYWVVIKEPNKQDKYEGDMYFMLESVQDETNTLLKFFGYRQSNNEPRLYVLPYSRELHEDLAKSIMPRLKSGQSVIGKLSKKKPGNSRKGKDKSEAKGDGSESQKQEWHFHELRPSDIHEKPE